MVLVSLVVALHSLFPSSFLILETSCSHGWALQIGLIPITIKVFFLLERHLAQVAWSLSVLNLICIPQSTHALDQGGVEPRQAVSPRPEAKDDTASLQRRFNHYKSVEELCVEKHLLGTMERVRSHAKMVKLSGKVVLSHKENMPPEFKILITVKTIFLLGLKWTLIFTCAGWL